MDADGLFSVVAKGFAFDFWLRAEIEQEADLNLGGFQVVEQLGLIFRY